MSETIYKKIKNKDTLKERIDELDLLFGVESDSIKNKSNNNKIKN